MNIEVELGEKENIPRSVQISTPKANIDALSQLFREWGLPDRTLKELKIRLLFCSTPYRGEYLGCRDGWHTIKLSIFYLFPDVPHRFLEEVTRHELRHLWWTLQKNPPSDLGERDCQKIEKQNAASPLWTLTEAKWRPNQNS